MSECEHEWYLKSGRGYLYCPLCGKTVPVENYVESLEAKLAAAETAKNELIDDLILERRKSSGHSSESMYFMQQVEKAKTDRDNLQAANAVLRGTLQEIEKCESPFKKDRLEFAESVIRKHAQLASDALKITPADACERVQGLVTALEEIMARCEIPKSEDDAHYENYYEAQAALQRYRGGRSYEAIP